MLEFESGDAEKAAINIENGWIKLGEIYLVKDGYTIPMPEPMPEE